MKTLLLGITLLGAMTTFAASGEIYSVIDRESGKVVKNLPNGQLKIKGSDSKKYMFVFPDDSLSEVKASKGYSNGTPVKFISGTSYLYGNVSHVFKGEEETIIKVLFEGDNYPSYLKVEDYEGNYSHILTKGCSTSFKGAKVGHALENEDGIKKVKYLFSDGSVVLEKRYSGGRSYHLTDIESLGYNSEESCI